MSWTHEQVLAELREVVAQHAENVAAEPLELAEHTELVADLGIDSLGVMEIVAELEDTFGMTIGDRELRNVATMGDVAKAIETRLRESGRLSS